MGASLSREHDGEHLLSNAPKKRKRSGTRARVDTAAPRPDQRGTTAAIALGALVAVGLIIAVAVLAFGRDDADVPDGLAFNGTALAPYVDGEPDDAIGEKAPIFTTEYLDGSYAFIGGGGGPNDTAKLVVFVAHWCPVCQAEVPAIADWVDANGLPEDVEVVMVSTFADEGRDNFPPLQWFDSAGWDAPVALDSTDGRIAEQFGFTSVPSWAVITNLNFVLERGTGPIDDADLARLTSLAALGG